MSLAVRLKAKDGCWAGVICLCPMLGRGEMATFLQSLLAGELPVEGLL